MEIIQSVMFKGIRFEKDEDVEVITKKGSKLLAIVSFSGTLDDGESLVLQEVDGLRSGWDDISLDASEVESIRIIKP